MNNSFKNSADLFEKITSIDNIRGAYFDLVKKFDEDAKSGRYKGLDGLNVRGTDFISEDIFPEIKNEMQKMQEISPAYMITIPKKNGKKRKIYVYSVKERIKAEAIYRVLEPMFDVYLSSFLFSYRSSHPSYYAARSAVRRYKRYYGENHILVTDISDYADSIDHDLLIGKIKTLSLGEKVNDLLALFIKTKTHEEGLLITRPRGVLTGTPLYALLANLFMDDFDKWAGKYVSFYRRVGDDIIAMDKDESKIKTLSDRLDITLKELKLNKNEKKANLIKDSEPFNFLGYRFSGGHISFDNSSLSKNKLKWKHRLITKSSKGKNIRYKINRLKRIGQKVIDGPNYDTRRLFEQKILVDDIESIRTFSDSVIGIASMYLFGKDNYGSRKRAKKILKEVNIDTPLGQYIKIRSRY